MSTPNDNEETAPTDGSPQETELVVAGGIACVAETEIHPMCEALYNQLTYVQGFQELNGWTYQDYCTKWLARSGNDTLVSGHCDTNETVAAV